MRTEKVKHAVLHGMMFLGLISFLYGCGGGGGGSNPVTPQSNPYVQPDPQSAPSTKSLSVDVSLPVASSLNNETLEVLTFYGSAQVLPKAKRALSATPTVKITDSSSGQIVIVSDSKSQPLFFAYVEGASTASGLTISTDEIAKGVLWMNPYVMVLPRDQRKELLAQAVSGNLFAQLKSKIDAVLVDDPKNLLNPDSHPEITKTAFAIVKDSFESLSAKYKFSDVGNEGDPRVKDGSGNEVILENPKMVSYGVEVIDSSGAKNLYLVDGKESLLSAQWGWPPVIITAPVEVTDKLNDGKYSVKFYKGFNFDVTNWWLPYLPGSPIQFSSDATIVGTAFWMNSLHTIGILVEALTEIDLDEHKALKRIVDDVGKIKGLDDYAGALAGGDSVEILKKTVSLLNDNWAVFADSIWGTALDSIDFLDAAEILVKNIAAVIKGVSWANEYLPFLYDLGTAPGKMEYCVTQTSGVLSPCSGFTSLIPPSASLTASPAYPYSGEKVFFDASGSTDDRTASLQYRWDFEDDGQWDVSWAYSSTASHAYTSAGNYVAKVEVKDGDGLTSAATHYVAVYDRSKAVSTAIVIDKSGSMSGQNYDGKPLKDAKEAAKSYVNILGAADRGAVISFDSGIKVEQNFTDDKNFLLSALDGITLGDTTSLFDAVYKAIDLTSAEDPGRRRAVVVLTDGSDNNSSHAKEQYDKEVSLKGKIDVINFALAKGIPVYTIGLQGYDFTTDSEKVLKDIAEKTGGLYFYAPDSSQLKDIYDTIAAIK